MANFAKKLLKAHIAKDENSAFVEPAFGIGEQVNVDVALSDETWASVKFADGRTGFVLQAGLSDTSLMVEPTVTAAEVFVESCLINARLTGANAGFLIAWAHAGSGTTWTETEIPNSVEAGTGRVGPFRFTPGEWTTLTAGNPRATIGAELANPGKQPFIAAPLAARLTSELATALGREVNSLDLYLAILLDVAPDSGVARCKALQGQDEKTVKALVGLLAVCGGDAGKRDALVASRPQLGAIGANDTLAQFYAALVSALGAGLQKAVDLLSEFAPDDASGQNDPTHELDLGSAGRGKYVNARSPSHLLVIYSDANGFEMSREGGTRAWRNNNPGNIEYGDFVKAQGAIGTDSRFAIFPDEATGLAAIGKLLLTTNYKTKIWSTLSSDMPPGWTIIIPLPMRQASASRPA